MAESSSHTTDLRPFLVRAVRLVDAFAGEGIQIDGHEDPVDVMLELMEALGLEDMDEVVPALERGHGI